MKNSREGGGGNGFSWIFSSDQDPKRKVSGARLVEVRGGGEMGGGGGSKAGEKLFRSNKVFGIFQRKECLAGKGGLVGWVTIVINIPQETSLRSIAGEKTTKEVTSWIVRGPMEKKGVARSARDLRPVPVIQWHRSRKRALEGFFAVRKGGGGGGQ